MLTAIDLCSLAWGDKPGYVAISVRDPKLHKQDQGYWRDITFSWPADRDKIEQVLNESKTSKNDVYWAPAVFTKPQRARTAVGTLNILWADLDEVDPADLPKHLKPTAAWETSPGRWQALWRLTTPLNADAQTTLNQRLTYAIGADKGGWDLTQVLRTPNTRNHKYETEPRVKMLWLNGHALDPIALVDDLPEVTQAIPAVAQESVLAQLPDSAHVLKAHRRDINARIRELVKARFAQVGQRSERLWELECLLAERGFTDVEIVAVTQPTVWNKFKDRTNELSQLLTEARKAIAHAGPVETDEGEDVLEIVEAVRPVPWAEFDKQHEEPRWLIADVWGESEVGFISGHPKTYKSWIALDLAVSISTGTRFLDSFKTRQHPVLLIQEEDPKPILQDRLVKIAAQKGLVWAKKTGPTSFAMRYELPTQLHIISNQGFVIEEEWLEQLEQWIMDLEVKVVILDPLMMIAGAGFDEFKAFDFMEKVLKPLKRLRHRTKAAIVVVHHHLKGGTQGGARDMYGSVALWAWEEAALHLSNAGVGKVVAERFSKNALLSPITLEIGDVKETWHPEITIGVRGENILDVLSQHEGGATLSDLSSYTNLTKGVLERQLAKFVQEGRLEQSTVTDGPGRPKKIWRLLHGGLTSPTGE